MTDFESLCLPHYSSIRRLCCYLLSRSGDGEDATQETFAKALSQYSELSERRAVKSWLMSIAYRHCIDVIRARKVRHHQPILEGSMEGSMERATEQSRLENIHLPHLALELRDILHQLPPQERDLLILKHYFGLDYQEISRVLMIPPEQVGMKLLRARKLAAKKITDGGLGRD